MGRFSVLTLTDAAVQRVCEIMAANAQAKGIIVDIKKGGCAGMEYVIRLCQDEDLSAFDVVERDGARVFVARTAALFLLGTQMDFEVTTLRTGFVFNNPNQTSACGCGESIEITPVAPEQLEAMRLHS